MKLSKWMTTMVAACALLVACDGKKDGSGKTLTVGVSADYAPFEYFKDGEIIGFDIDLMKEIAKRLDKDVNFKDMSFDAILGSLSTSRLDAAISSITPTNERRKSIDFSQEYIQSNRVLVCKGTSSVESASDLAGDTVGVQAGSTHETYAKEKLGDDVNITVKSLNKVPDLLQDMEIGNVTCLVLGVQEAEAIKDSKPNIKLLTLPGEVSGAAIAFPKGSPLTAQVDKIIDEMQADGSLDKLKTKWLITQPSAPSEETKTEGTSTTPVATDTASTADTTATETAATEPPAADTPATEPTPDSTPAAPTETSDASAVTSASETVPTQTPATEASATEATPSSETTPESAPAVAPSTETPTAETPATTPATDPEATNTPATEASATKETPSSETTPESAPAAAPSTETPTAETSVTTPAKEVPASQPSTAESTSEAKPEEATSEQLKVTSKLTTPSSSESQTAPSAPTVSAPPEETTGNS